MSALSRLFSSSVLREMAKKGRSGLFARLFSESGLAPSHPDQSVAECFEAAFGRLRRAGLRNEYIYRAALTHNVLLGSHSLATASMLTEFRTGASKADLVILNGTATVYEIKSDRDSLSRLEKQLADYQKVFAKIYVIAGEAHLRDVLEAAPPHVGVMRLARWDRITIIREASDRASNICPRAVFQSLRLSEAQSVLRDLGVIVPEAPNTLLHAVVGASFERLDPDDVHRSTVKTLKRSRGLASLGELVDRLPRSLQPAALSVQIRRKDHDRLVRAIETPLHAAMTWT
ncbi:sce7726 family protein [Dongia sedimenti]|uniref:Sce7726 family protein n=1 Tax=Dongia sedimenti TaxID=3064282 RepID=A0ABU0YKA2_9PROT|nr:sce7726 family protein [Rhodospirillaceae bacterium R-7]